MKKETILGVIGLILFILGIVVSYISISVCSAGQCKLLNIYLPIIMFALGVIFSIWALLIAAKKKKKKTTKKV